MAGARRRPLGHHRRVSRHRLRHREEYAVAASTFWAHNTAWAERARVAAGLGFGLALAPVNAALLATTADAVHGVASALLVVARMVGMLVGISVLTAVGLRRYYAVTTDLPAPGDVCETGTQCAAYTLLLKEAGLAQLQTVFAGAAVCAAAAGVIAANRTRHPLDARTLARLALDIAGFVEASHQHKVMARQQSAAVRGISAAMAN